MKVYVAGLIDKSLRTINANLRKKLVSDCQKSLQASRKAMFSQELNSFIVVSRTKFPLPNGEYAVRTSPLFVQKSNNSFWYRYG